MNFKCGCSGGYWVDVEIEEDSEFPKQFMYLTPEFWSLSPSTLEEFKKKWKITHITEIVMGPCGRGIYTIKDNVFEWGKYGGFEPPLEKENHEQQ